MSGLAYYISPPQTLADLAHDPLHAVLYLIFILSSCALFSKTWIEVGWHSAMYVCMCNADRVPVVCMYVCMYVRMYICMHDYLYVYV